MLTVTQNAQPNGTPQSRSYSYDLLGRVTSETNPETGATQYTYDVACTTTPASPGDLTRKVDNAGNNTCFAYDAFHRPTAEGWNTVCRFFNYDASVTPPSGITAQNTKGRLLEAFTTNCGSTQYTDEWFSYSQRGELADFYELTPHSGSSYYHTSASYWANGVLQTLGGPSVPIFYYGASEHNGAGLDGEGRVTQVLASIGTDPVSNVTYSTTSNPNYLGALTGITYGSSDADSFTYDPNTGRPLSYAFTLNGNSDSGQLNWNSNGTLGGLAISDTIPGTSDTQSCTFSYDDLGRAGGQDCGSGHWQQSFSYDAFGNISKSCSGGGCSFAPTYNAATNQFTLNGFNIQYDGDGNLKTDNMNTYTWDPNWGDATSVNGMTATYDAFGRVVEQQSGSGYAQTLYSPVGKIALMNGTSLTKAFIPLPGGGTAIYNSSGLQYYRHPDWLGSSRLTSTSARTLFSSTAYAPFGEQYSVSGTADPSFTGQNSDTVSSLYDFSARRQSPSQGRWISPDPAGFMAADPSDPQTWNRYAYVLNRPSTLTDPTGNCPIGRGGKPICIPAGTPGSFPEGLDEVDEFDLLDMPVYGWEYGYVNVPDQSYSGGVSIDPLGAGTISFSVGGLGLGWYWGVIGNALDFIGSTPAGGGTSPDSGPGKGIRTPKPNPPQFCWGTFGFGGGEYDAVEGGAFSGGVWESNSYWGNSGGALQEAWAGGEGPVGGVGKITTPSDTSVIQGWFGFVGGGINAGPFAGLQVGYIAGYGWGGLYIEGHLGTVAGGTGAYVGTDCKKEHQ